MPTEFFGSPWICVPIISLLGDENLPIASQDSQVMPFDFVSLSTNVDNERTISALEKRLNGSGMDIRIVHRTATTLGRILTRPGHHETPETYPASSLMCTHNGSPGTQIADKI
ncbi:hypothetical protein ACOME3_009057 [Neoechinorhynchus agilis]